MIKSKYPFFYYFLENCTPIIPKMHNALQVLGQFFTILKHRETHFSPKNPKIPLQKSLQEHKKYIKFNGTKDA